MGLPTRQALVEAALANKASSHSVWSTMKATGDAMNKAAASGQSAPAVAASAASSSAALPSSGGKPLLSEEVVTAAFAQRPGKSAYRKRKALKR